MCSRMKLIGDSEGIKFSYGGSTANTFDSHRLIWKAREEGGSMLQDKLVEILFKAYFEEEKCIGEQSVLMNCAERAGMDATEMFQDTNIGKKEQVWTQQKCSKTPISERKSRYGRNRNVP